MSEWRVSGFDEVRELGRGAQGRVVLARHAERGAPVAIKYLAPGADPAARDRFRREAALLGQVRDPHVARLYRLVEHGEHMAIVMEAVDGVSYREILGRYGALDPLAALAALKGSLRGLAAAHAAGVVHRDYKPANVIVPADGGSKLIDFGVATVRGEASGAGTPLYMAPEQWRGEPASPATDVYAATCVFYESVTGRRPYGPDRAAVRAGHLTRPVPVEDVPEPLRPLVERGMAKDPRDRPAGAAAFAGELEDAARSAYGADWEARGLRTLAGAAVAFAAVFPLVAAGLVPGAAASGAAAAGGTAATAGSSGVLSALGTKGAVAVAGTAVVGTTAAGIGVYQATRPDPPERRVAAATSSPAALPGRPVNVGPLRLTLPEGWRVTKLAREGASYRVDVPGRCPSAEGRRVYSHLYNNACPSFAVVDEYGLFWKGPEANRTEATYRRGSFFHPSNDVGHVCPPDPDPARHIGALGERRVRQGTARVGNRTAEYYEWRMRCVRADTQGRVSPSDPRFTQRTWFLPQSRILVVDEWGTPGLDRILERATWI
ncbi:serine/threonine-protein kinase [Actinomadura namibiensis]|uniref:non-specific serine/threonine protein kinase n=1 Tax=Actinomadura namibiensis TaxID=182080 RepID=A0A7W3LQ95_ACTNM|nr:serine/threonine-protein kinase [Actinomadura namibiensis]MBA8952299.1 tRNA A-37 threonylcarbamoyl transferase component Bud32 [Actinomadura namibiensis]